jgi:hypothetical protein
MHVTDGALFFVVTGTGGFLSTVFETVVTDGVME